MNSMTQFFRKPLGHLLITALLLSVCQVILVPHAAEAGSVSFGSDTGSGFGTVSIPYNAKLDVGDGAFNLEMWVKEISRSPLGGQYTASFWSSSVQHYYHERNTLTSSFMWGLSFDGPNFFAAWRANQNYFYPAGSDMGYTDTQSSNTKTASQVYNTFADAEWHHIALSKTGVNGTLSMYLDGVRVLYVPVDDKTYSLLGGDVVLGGLKFVGQIGDVRLVKGQALYTGPSITVPTSQITTTSQGALASNVSLLLKASGTVCAVEDVSDNHFSVLLNGTTCSTATTRPISSYNVQFDSQGHGTKPADAVGVTSIPFAGLPTQSTDGYFEFRGWSTTSSGDVLTGDYTVTADSTLYAIWQDNSPVTYTVTYALEGGSGSPTQGNVAEGASFTTAASTGITKAGYTFTGWNDGSANYAPGSTYTVGTSNILLTARWSSDSIPVNYNSNGGSVVSSSTVVIGGSIAEGPANPTRAGYTFVKWQQAGVDVSFPYQPILSTGVTLSVTTAALVDLGLYENKGYWDPTVWYGPNRGTTPSSTRDFVTYIDGGKYIAIRETFNSILLGPIRLDGYYLVPLDTSVTLTATWTAKPLRSINYNLNGGRYDDKKLNPIQTSLASGSTFKIASGNELSKPGYSFGGWSDGTTTYAGGATYTIGNSNLLLSAIWIPRVYRITWNIKTNGGTRGGLLGALTYSVGVPVFTFPTDAQKVGKVFAGWYTSAKGGTKINSGYLVTAPYGEVTFYAQFR